MSTATAIVQVEETIVRVGKREVAVRGFRISTLESHLWQHASGGVHRNGGTTDRTIERWCTMDCLARLFWGNANYRRDAGKRVSQASKFLLEKHGIFLLKEYKNGGYGPITACKICDPLDPADVYYAQKNLEIMKQRGDVTQSQIEAITRIINGSAQKAVTEAGSLPSVAV